jgi:hypothetical protein
VLTSDAGGRGHWAELPAEFNLGEAYGLYGIVSNASFTAGSYIDLGFSFTANEPGFYAFEVRWWAKVQDAALGGSYIPQHFRLLRNGGLADEFEAYTNTIGSAQDYCTLSFVLYSEVSQANQSFAMQLRPGYFPVAADSSEPWMTTWVNIVRMY